ncbi:MAG: hypothetical protein LBE48_00165 [Methanomassiliicoccaceae archaeon]|jgi:Zn finger protein HypA/HybF involved in hydrogenase expression|nr:hypothetical protein [Methanomassiliicoccaceae archaeon]
MEDAKSTDIIKCSNCNASMRFSISNNALKCDHCGQIEKIEGGNNNVVRRELTDNVMKEHEPWNDSVVFRCSLCSALIDVDKHEIMKMCPFCGNPAVIKTEELPGIKPDSLIPYTVTKRSATELFSKWIRSKLYAPGKCRKHATAENVNSVYSPVWSFTANTSSHYNGMLGEDYTVTVTDSKGNTHTETRTRWFRVSGYIDANYTDVFIPSGKQIPKKMADKLEPYPMNKAVGYRQEYLAGRAAEHYSRDIKTCFDEFGKYVYADLCQRIKRKYNADHVGKMDIDTTYKTKYFNYVLLPNYIANFKYKDKLYNFYVNGATGEVVGKYPLSAVKIAFTIIAIGAAIYGLFMIF